MAIKTNTAQTAFTLVSHSLKVLDISKNRESESDQVQILNGDARLQSEVFLLTKTVKE
jgi:hypothetical protein